jgi:hypothetical protein
MSAPEQELLTQGRALQARAAVLVEQSLADRLGTARFPTSLARVLHPRLASLVDPLCRAAVVGAGRAGGGEEADALPAACAVECLLVGLALHRDLPVPGTARSERRQGFSLEAAMALCGDALFCVAFESLAAALAPATRVTAAIAEVGRGVQAACACEDSRAAVVGAGTAAGALLAGAGTEGAEALREFGRRLAEGAGRPALEALVAFGVEADALRGLALLVAPAPEA